MVILKGDWYNECVSKTSADRQVSFIIHGLDFTLYFTLFHSFDEVAYFKSLGTFFLPTTTTLVALFSQRERKQRLSSNASKLGLYYHLLEEGNATSIHLLACPSARAKKIGLSYLSHLCVLGRKRISHTLFGPGVISILYRHYSLFFFCYFQAYVSVPVCQRQSGTDLIPKSRELGVSPLYQLLCFMPFIFQSAFSAPILKLSYTAATQDAAKENKSNRHKVDDVFGDPFTMAMFIRQEFTFQTFFRTSAMKLCDWYWTLQRRG